MLPTRAPHRPPAFEPKEAVLVSWGGFPDPLRTISGAVADSHREHNILVAQAAEALGTLRLDLPGSPLARLREGPQKAQSLA